jgi:hypothetical protein
MPKGTHVMSRKKESAGYAVEKECSRNLTGLKNFKRHDLPFNDQSQ